MPAGETISVRVYLGLRDQAGAEARLASVSTPGGAGYQQYLTPAQFRDAYSPSQGDADRVSTWLARAGLTVGDIPANRFSVAASGTVAQVEKAFGTKLQNITTAAGQRRVPAGAPTIPSDLAAVVQGVGGLGQVLLSPLHVGGRDEGASPTAAARTGSPSLTQGVVGTDAPPAPGFRNAPPCSAWWGQKSATGLPALGSGYPAVLAWAPCGWKPPQLRSAYGTSGAVAGGNDGRGVRVAIVDAFASPTIVDDASTYAQRNDPTYPLKPGQYDQRVFRPFRFQQDCDIQGWYGEQTLDVEAVHAMAPGAKILYVGARSCDDGDIDAALLDVVDNNRAQIVSNSYGNTGEVGIPQAEVRHFNNIAIQAGLQGIGLYFSSGDDGDNSDNPDYTGPSPAPDFSATSPFVTAVGSTSLGITASGAVAVEQGWSTGISSLDASATAWVPGGRGAFQYGAGGGASRLFQQPAYQAGVVPNSVATSIGGPKRRVVPDVGVVGDPNTGMLIGQTQTFLGGVQYGEFRIGGTSLSSPLFAGVMALADQNGGRHGFANPLLYSLSGSSAWRDIVPGAKTAVVRRNYVNFEDASAGFSPPTARTFDSRLESLRTAVGYDTLTGLGAPNGQAFLKALDRR